MGASSRPSKEIHNLAGKLMRTENRSLKNYQYGTERQKRHQILAPLAGNSLVFSRKVITSAGFCTGAAP